jgi:hypothetical protein
MAKYSELNCVSHGHTDVDEFVAQHLVNAERVLFIGTVGIEASSLHFANELKDGNNIDFRFLIERRAGSNAVLAALGVRHRAWLNNNLQSGTCTFDDVEIIAKDGATVAGRNAVNVATKWYTQDYSDIVVDSSGMSRGVCFPLLRQAMVMGEKLGANVHLLMASNNRRTVKLVGQPNDRADWMHGFREDMGLASMEDALMLWMPQLSPGSLSQMKTMYLHLQQSGQLAEVCPIVPFPSLNPRRGDELLFEHRDAFQGNVGSAGLSAIYAHESDPMDVFRSIVRMENVRRELFDVTGKTAVSVLSPSGWRLGSLGMVLAAITMNLPLLYVETIGYTTTSVLPPASEIPLADVRWHIWIAGSPYAVLSDQ